MDATILLDYSSPRGPNLRGPHFTVVLCLARDKWEAVIEPTCLLFCSIVSILNVMIPVGVTAYEQSNLGVKDCSSIPVEYSCKSSSPVH